MTVCLLGLIPRDDDLSDALESSGMLAARDFRRAERLSGLEARISTLPTTQERGAVFEVFVEAYLAMLAVEPSANS